MVGSVRSHTGPLSDVSSILETHRSVAIWFMVVQKFMIVTSNWFTKLRGLLRRMVDSQDSSLSRGYLDSPNLAPHPGKELPSPTCHRDGLVLCCKSCSDVALNLSWQLSGLRPVVLARNLFLYWATVSLPQWLPYISALRELLKTCLILFSELILQTSEDNTNVSLFCSSITQ